MGTICTASGTVFDFEDPSRSTFTLQDIAHALSHICRFTGHVREFYSVAQHSVLVSYLVPPEDALAGLLHDGAEAFIGDVSSPLKRMLPDYKAIERRVETEVLGRFGLTLPLPASVKKADLVMLQTEKRDLMHPSSQFVDWSCLNGIEPDGRKIMPWNSAAAYTNFMNRFNELTS